MDAPELRQVLNILDRVRREWHAARIFGGLALFLALSLGVSFVLVVAAMLAPLPVSARWGFMISWLLSLCVFAIVLIFKRFLENPTEEDVALLIEASQPSLHNEMINAIRLGKHPAGQNPVLVRAAIRESDRKAADLDTRGAVSWREAKRSAVAAGVMVLVWVVLFLGFRARAANALSRIIRPAANLPKIGSVRILEVTPGDVTVIVGENVTIGALLDQPTDGTAKPRLHHFVVGGAANEERMYPLDDTRFTCELLDIRAPRVYRVAVGNSQSRNYNISVTERPRVIKIPVTYTFPRYAGLEDLTVEDTGGMLRALKGTAAALSILANKRLRAAGLVVGADEPISLFLAPGRIQASAQRHFKIIENTPGRIEIEDEYGCRNERSIEIIAVDDAVPQVNIVSPAEDRVIAVGGSLDLAIRGTDDYGIARAELIERRMRPGAEKPDAPAVVRTWTDFSDRKNVSIRWTWAFAKKSYQNGEIVRYLVRMVDGKNIGEPGVGTSAEFVVRLEDAAARQKQRDEKYRGWEERLQRVLVEQKELRRDTDGLRQQVSPETPGKPPNGEEKKKDTGP